VRGREKLEKGGGGLSYYDTKVSTQFLTLCYGGERNMRLEEIFYPGGELVWQKKMGGLLG